LGLPGLQPGLADKLQVAKAVAESDADADKMELQRAMKESEEDELQRKTKESEEDELQRAIKLSRMSAEAVSFLGVVFPCATYYLIHLLHGAMNF
jgi:hypothetical protein